MATPTKPVVAAPPPTAVPDTEKFAGVKAGPTDAGAPSGMFQPPPAHAPKEVSQPLDPLLIEAQAAKAALNEKELQPLQVALDKAIASAAGATAAASQTAHAVVTAPPAAAPNAPAGTAGTAGTTSSTPTVPEPKANHQPAASDTDSPSRGMPKPITDPGKVITGGWGQDGGFEAQYYALDGTELLALIRTIWASLQSSLDTDLRFGIASVYPQVAARVTIEIGGAHAGATVNEVAFTLESKVYGLSGVRVDDNSTPADALRVEADLDRPFKRVLRTPTGTFIVDRVAPNAIPGDTVTE